jgi:hypothetical protein
MRAKVGKARIVGIAATIAVFLLISLLPLRVAQAILSLSITPFEGGYDIRFGKISYTGERINREIKLRVTSDIGKQYRVIQVVSDPLRTDAVEEFPFKNLVVYGLRGTNSFGTLHVEQAFPVNLNRQVLYTSSTSGASDSFTLVYSLIPPEQVHPGSYRGRISFVLQPIDSTQDQVIETINVFAEIDVASSVTVTTPTGGKNILLRSDRSEESERNKVLVNIVGGVGRQFRIVQSVTGQPLSSEGNRLDWQAVQFIGRGAQKGMLINEATALSTRQQIIYTSSPRGEADSFEIEYSLADMSRQKEGSYRTSFKYFLDGPDAQMRLLETIGLEVEHPRVFELSVTPENKRGILRFEALKPKEPPKVNEVIVEIKSNIGRRYQVTQNVYSDLINRQGDVIPPGYFTIRTESLDTKGNLRFSARQGVKKGDTALFISDDKGSSDKFKIIYELTIPADVPAGDYSTRISYSLIEI